MIKKKDFKSIHFNFKNPRKSSLRLIKIIIHFKCYEIFRPLLKIIIMIIINLIIYDNLILF